VGIASGIKDITQDITFSYELRTAEVERLRKEAKEMLSGFQASHKEMSTELRRDLAQDKRKMRAEVKSMRDDFQTSHKEMGTALRKDLSGHTQAVKGEVAKMRQEIKASHREVTTELRKGLAQGVTARKSEVAGTLNGFHSSRKQTGAKLRKELANYDRGIKNEVAGVRQETRADLREAATAWQELASTMQAKRAGVRVPPKVEVPVEEKVEAPILEEAPVAEEAPDLEERLLAAITEHPDGITLAEVAESLGVVPVVLGRASRSLLERGLIHKEEKIYFPVASE
jgi:hypothetical protein